MRLIVTTFVGMVFGFWIGVCFPTLSLTKVPGVWLFYLIFALLLFQRSEYRCSLYYMYTTYVSKMMEYSQCFSIWQLNLPSSLLPNTDLSYVDDQRSGISTQTLLNALNPLNHNNSSSTQAQLLNGTSKVCYLYLVWCPELQVLNG